MPSMSLNLAEPAAARRCAALLVAVATLMLTACAQQDTELQQTHAYMDSLRLYLGDLRLMNHELNQIVEGDSIGADIIIPIIAEQLRPTMDDLRQRADRLVPTPAVAQAHGLLVRYLDTRLQAYDAALQGQAEDRPELFDLFALKQIEAQDIGDELETEAQRLRTQIPEYE